MKGILSKIFLADKPLKLIMFGTTEFNSTVRGKTLATDVNKSASMLSYCADDDANGAFILDGKLYQVTFSVSSTGTISSARRIPLNSSSSGSYATDWSFISETGTGAIRAGKIYFLHPNSPSWSGGNYDRRELLYASLGNEDHTWVSCWNGVSNSGSYSMTYALDNNNSLYKVFYNSSTKIADNVTAYFENYYATSSGLYYYNGTSSTQISSSTDWIFMKNCYLENKVFAISNGNLYLLTTSQAVLLDSSGWTEVAGGNIQYSSGSWRGACFGIKSGSVVAISLSGTESSPTISLSTIDNNGECSKLSTGIVKYNSHAYNEIKTRDFCLYLRDTKLYAITQNSSNNYVTALVNNIDGITTTNYQFEDIKGFGGYYRTKSGSDTATEEYTAYALAREI